MRAMNTCPKNDKDICKWNKIHRCRKYYQVCNVLYPFQDRNDVIPMTINMSFQSQRRDWLTQVTQKNPRSMDVFAHAVI